MIHGKEHLRGARAVKSGPARVLVALLIGSGLTAACDGSPNQPGESRFGQVGELLVEVRSPVAAGAGLLDEALLWRSDGQWVLVERLGYAGRPGGESVRRPTLNPGELAAEYASFVRQLNDTPGLRLLTPEVPEELDPACADGRSRVTVTLRDEPTGRDARWHRCADGTLFTTSSGSAGPDPGAARVVTAAQLARSFTLGDEARSSFLGSAPFATLGVGDDSSARAGAPLAFRSDDGQPPAEWEEFWSAHGDPDLPSPTIDWHSEMVLVAAMGMWPEAGAALKVQRVLPIEGGTRIELVRTEAGDFCSPASRELHPFHIVATPRRPGAILFNDPLVERIPCGV